MKKIIFITAALLLAAFAASAQTGQVPNRKNLVIKEWTTAVGSTTKVLDHVTTYNADGRKIEEIEYYSNSRMKWRRRYEYAPDGKVSRELLYDGKNRLNTVRRYEYNELDQRKTQYNYDGKGKLRSVKVFEYVSEDA
ncbi:MAG: hypothetical protein J6Y27_08350 [Bacteroidales bacterium]|nr:hypothetical protein [Bacteroidales bacterium]MBP5390334.1 hypothetical protein [Bacteroidales bacterium]